MAKSKKINVQGLVLMIFGSIFGFANTTIAFYLMGYASIIWYILAAIFFFLPTSLMFAEFGSSLKESRGGIYSWLEASIGKKAAFIGTFIWLASWIVWMVSTAAKVWVPFSTFLQGSDQTATWHLLGMNGTQVVGVLGILWILLLTFLSSRGIDKIQKFASFSGMAVAFLFAAFLVISVAIWFKTGFHLAEPIHGTTTFVKSPMSSYQTPIGMLSFVVFSIFAYAGMEAMGGVTDSMDQPEKTFPKGLMIATVFITLIYAVAIFMWGISTNWQQVLSGNKANMGNITYVLMQNLGYQFGHAFGMTTPVAMTIGTTFARITGLIMFISYLGAFAVLIYSPLKSFVLGTPKALWPNGFAEVNKHGMPEKAMWAQALLVCILIAVISFGGKAAGDFYNVLTLMSNVSTSLPYLFLVTAFPYFKARKDLERPYEFFKSPVAVKAVTIVVDLVLVFGIAFTIIQPMLEGQYLDAFWMVIGPIVFTIMALALYHRYQRKAVHG
ncbi:glutamate/gamma-aminobutyrate family transporter YjeM [Latilactobacillus curvatus]|uniref:Glutamate/gamma-aminobutyrate family transporter YjeM n=1 Tax=Latilactobacillus curvatus TaxID=28038 RepID=A0AAJ5USW6_LATCU|nr:glutamate/gamma-aminobutyrate family transporter YjeM [Latilactobacillus curvatus]MCP8847675.1 glutamate/gamma-aminobutyrate family transporter YjeM [Latilactobacillus curvatus]MCP8862469.1 glutamate/gamma-aminobutyrate family transporter YjeM [Latilactobacillus curvatus]MCP8864345.1 glutamate/gamma-aminobutyrate family transporter YjeM [Latilactobacillus curvatus]MCP8873220.1 glutamate/gamma-aminobutyrate family transporter YjeM [Latilactobacillus curvatus]MCP8875012.1 glutamate/gamma-amin